MLLQMLDKIQRGTATATDVLARHDDSKFGFGAQIDLSPSAHVGKMKEISSTAIRKSAKMGEADIIKLKNETEVLKQIQSMQGKALPLYVSQAETHLAFVEQQLDFQQEMAEVNQSLIGLQRGVVAKMADKAHANNMGQAGARAKKKVYAKSFM